MPDPARPTVHEEALAPTSAPLVPRARALTEAEARRHSRTTAIPQVGEAGQSRLRQARVVVVGAGGLGSPVLAYLVGAGIGRVTMIDNDVVEEHNLQRQVVHGTSTLGVPKVVSAAARLRDLNPEVDLVERDLRLTSENATDELAGHDLVVDATDNLPVRFAIAAATAELDLPVVYGSISSSRAQVTVFRESWGLGLRDLVDEDQAEGVTRLDEVGVLAPVTGLAGSLMATEVMKLIMGVGEPLFGRLVYVDAFSGRIDTLVLTPRAVAIGEAGGQLGTGGGDGGVEPGSAGAQDGRAHEARVHEGRAHDQEGGPNHG